MNECLNCKKPVKNKFCNVSCQNKYQSLLRARKKLNEIEKFEVKCYYCNDKFIVKEGISEFPKKEKYYCSRSCANSHGPLTAETKNKISNSLKGNTPWNKNYKIIRIGSNIVKIKNPVDEIELECKYCVKKIKVGYSKRNQKFCSKSCATRYRNKYEGLATKAGKASAAKRVKRSKNEMYFANLCKQKFEIILTNERMFNGWDADVIIPGLKIAILWNGKWHYEKICKGHSLKQVQNRDRIKLNEIKKCGYSSYIIKDMGKYNPEFVTQEFDKFLKVL